MSKDNWETVPYSDKEDRDYDFNHHESTDHQEEQDCVQPQKPECDPENKSEYYDKMRKYFNEWAKGVERVAYRNRQIVAQYKELKDAIDVINYYIVFTEDQGKAIMKACDEKRTAAKKSIEFSRKVSRRYLNERKAFEKEKRQQMKRDAEANFDCVKDLMSRIASAEEDAMLKRKACKLLITHMRDRTRK